MRCPTHTAIRFRVSGSHRHADRPQRNDDPDPAEPRSPLVLLTALQSGWEPDACSSEFVSIPRPKINDAGQYEIAPNGRPIRVCTRLDTRLMFADFYAKLEWFAAESKQN